MGSACSVRLCSVLCVCVCRSICLLVVVALNFHRSSLNCVVYTCLILDRSKLGTTPRAKLTQTQRNECELC